MPTVGITQAPGPVIVLGEEERSVGASAVFSKKSWLTDCRKRCGRSKAMAHWLRRFACKIGHEESAGDSFSGDVADHQPEPSAAQTRKS